MIRKLLALPLLPVLKVTGWRFSKHYRWGSTLWHRMVYASVDVVWINCKAGPRIVS